MYRSDRYFTASQIISVSIPDPSVITTKLNLYKKADKMNVKSPKTRKISFAHCTMDLDI